MATGIWVEYPDKHLQANLKGTIKMKTLSEMKPGSQGRIKRLSVRDKLGQRLMDMGI
jgi:hypothetical protein